MRKFDSGIWLKSITGGLRCPLGYVWTAGAQRVKGGSRLSYPWRFASRLPLTRPSGPTRWPPSASCSCISCCPTGCPPHGGAGRRPASGRSSRQGTSPPPASVGGSPGSAARSRCWCGCGSSARWENRSRSAFPQCRPRPSWQLPSVSWRAARRPRLSPSHGTLFCSPGRGSP